jgi:hypothetical protein
MEAIFGIVFGVIAFLPSLAIQTMNVAFDPDAPGANANGTIFEAVTKDQLNIGLSGHERDFFKSNLVSMLKHSSE